MSPRRCSQRSAPPSSLLTAARRGWAGRLAPLRRVLHTTLRLRHPPAVLAAGALNLSALLLERAQQLPHQWWLYFDMDMAVLEGAGGVPRHRGTDALRAAGCALLQWAAPVTVGLSLESSVVAQMKPH